MESVKHCLGSYSREMMVAIAGLASHSKYILRFLLFNKDMYMDN